VVPRLDIRLTDGATRCEVVLAVDGVTLRSNGPFSSPVTAADADDIRWLLEEYPAVAGPSTAPIAERVEARLVDLGADLGSQLFPGALDSEEIVARFHDDPGLMSQVQVVVEEDPTSSWIPWEVLTLPGADIPLSLSAGSFTRHQGSVPPDVPSAGVQRTLRVLLVVARPAGGIDVPFRSVASRMVQAAAASAGAMTIDVLRPATYAALDEALSRAAAAGTGYHVVHFDGHGVYRAGAFSPIQRGFLRFEGVAGGAEEIDGSTVGKLLVRRGVDVLLLNACRSGFSAAGEAGTERAFGSLAGDALGAGLRSVLAMGFNIYVVAAARLIADVYAALGAGRSVAQAVSHARLQRASRPGPCEPDAFDWLVPVLYDSGGSPLVEGSGDIPTLPVTTSTTTPADHRVLDPAGKDGPRDAARAFYGRDTDLLRLDRAMIEGAPIELIGLAGSGKSALASEFARWWCATGGSPGVAAVVDVGLSYGELAEAVAAHGQLLDDQPTLWIFDGADATLSWPGHDRDEFNAFLAALAPLGSRAILTGRISIGLANAIVLEGLDDEASRELAVEAVGEPAPRGVAVTPLLEWAGGLPALVGAIPELLAAAGESARDSQRLLDDLRAARGIREELITALLARCGVEVFDVSKLKSVTLPFVLHLYQGFISTLDWNFFGKTAALKGLTLSHDPEEMHVELVAAQRAGLACRTAPDRYLLHPLAPPCLAPGYVACVTVLTNMNEAAKISAMGMIASVYCQEVSLITRVPQIGREVVSGLPAARHHRQNLWRAAEESLAHAWWGLAFPLLQLLREALLAAGRIAEWQAILTETLANLERYPPDPRNMGAEDTTRHVALLRADAAIFQDDPAPLAALRARQVFAADPDAVELVDESGDVSLHFERNRLMSQLMREGDAAAKRGSADCIDLYKTALSLAEQANDPLRIGEAELALGRAYRKVEAVKDLSAAEEFSRRAIRRGDAEGLGADLVSRGKLGVGNAILDQLMVENLKGKDPVDPERLREAQAAFDYAASAGSSDGGTKAAARNGRAGVAALEGKLVEASDYYLQAVAEFEVLKDADGVAAAQTNAALALARAGRNKDAVAIARQAQNNLSRAPSLAVRLAPILDAIIGAAG
jgi:hypothetical protein